MANVKNINFSKIVFDLPMTRTLLNHAINITKNKNITVGNTQTFGKLPRWRNQMIGNNYAPVMLTKNRKFPGMYVIQNGRHRIAKLYSEGKRTVRARVV